ncbi:MerR family transcriptional regulator [Paracoccus sp. (in: a-proteobacteria)]|uniref:MerR family transcriptional regulator n=1 Tax=Paracoccus sp. TaxID=267 RepID=UPI0026E0C237|nr:MerR family transcriptional regulator [Paracoccus sp. (in: a-proteobacteria)]MDO5646973.1 MerR family transcriptional regulator [Paracoccus sp. (in: a-proteobacteria)]
MSKGAGAFRSIGEVAQLIGVAPHVLRYWETQFSALRPMKRSDGRRYYRPDDVRLAAGLCQVLRDDGMTIRGAKKMIAADRGAALRDLGDARLAQGPVEPRAKPAPLPRRAPRGPAPLPLFPAPPASAWLPRLTRLARQLDRMTAQDARWQHARPLALKLRRAITATSSAAS